MFSFMKILKQWLEENSTFNDIISRVLASDSKQCFLTGGSDKSAKSELSSSV